ncbi:hypothetical protein OROMI_018309 [Orobanche minor]
MASERFRAFKSNFSCSSHVLLGPPLIHPPTTNKLSTLLTGAEACLLRTCPNHLNLPSLAFAEMDATSSAYLKTPFGILSNNVRPHDHRNILISATSNLLSSDFFIAQYSEPYNIAEGLSCRTRPLSDLESSYVFSTAGHKGLKFWDIRDPFRSLRDYPIQGAIFGVDWVPHLRCVFGVLDDGTLWLLNLEKVSHDIPVTGKRLATTKTGLNNFDCSSFSLCSAHASRHMVAYCGEEGNTFCFQPTIKSVKDTRNRVYHYLYDSLLEAGPACCYPKYNNTIILLEGITNNAKQILGRVNNTRFAGVVNPGLECSRELLFITDSKSTIINVKRSDSCN